jgi:sulfite exporter TauE/SafE
MSDPLVSMAQVTGLYGTGHCLGMCGGLVAALALAGEGRRGIGFHLLYNSGRITTYTLIGLAVGWLGSAIAYTDAFRQVSRMVLVGSDLFVIALGLGTAGLFARFNVMWLELGGLPGLTGVAARLGRRPGALAGFPLGLLMGFLPCGFLYARAITAAQAADPRRGALILLAFGVGTLPGLVLFGSGTNWLGARLRQGMLRVAGMMVALMGTYNLFRHGQLLGWW